MIAWCSAGFLDRDFAGTLKLDAGEVQYRLEEDPISLRIYWVTILEKLAALPLTLAYLLYSALRLSPALTLAMLGVAAVKLLVPAAVRKLGARYDAQTRAYRTALRACESEITGEPQAVKLFGLQRAFLARFDRLYRGHYDATESKDIACKAFAEHASLYLDTACTLLVLLLGAWMAARGLVTPGAVAAMTGYLTVAYTLFNDAGDTLRNIPLLRNVADRMTVFYEDPEPASGGAVGSPSALCARGLSFCYGERTVFSGLDFTIRRGDRAAITGKNGSGKSTLLRVLCGLLRGYGGELTLDGRPLRSLSPGEWRRQLAYAPQTPYLFRGSVRENVRLGNPDVSDARIDEVLGALGIGTLADRQVSMKTELSGGERQKLSIARAILRDAPVLILDEPANHLDRESLDRLRAYLERTDRTVLLVSHQDAFPGLANVTIGL